ncbi:MAG: SDR family NAD(P)-dependent oxidoreductase [Solirubrobacteraceae bacterium]
MTVSRRLEGRAALVTGAGSGIGAATAARLAAEGADVICTDVRADAARLTAQAIGGGAHAIAHDVTDRGSWEQVSRACIDRLGRLDILVNNAGFTRDRSLLKMTDSEWQGVIDVHLRGAWLGCQQAVALMRTGGGSIVNLASESRHGSFGQANYAAAKAGVVGLTRTVALEHARHAVRCNAVAPGMVRTPLIASVPGDISQQLRARIPLQRFAEPEEIAAAIAFLASPDASYITGQTLNCDGGTTWS